MACININLPEYKQLVTSLTAIGISNPVRIQARIMQYQAAYNTDEFPPIDYFKVSHIQYVNTRSNQEELNNIKTEELTITEDQIDESLMDYVYDNADFLKLDSVMLKLLKDRVIDHDRLSTILDVLTGYAGTDVQLNIIGNTYTYKGKEIKIDSAKIDRDGDLMIISGVEWLFSNTLYKDSPELYLDVVRELLIQSSKNLDNQILNDNSDLFETVFEILSGKELQDNFANTILEYLTSRLHKLKPNRTVHGILDDPMSYAKTSGIYRPITDQVLLNYDDKQITFLHEMVHKFTVYPFLTAKDKAFTNLKLRPFEKEYVNQITELYNYTLNNTSDIKEYGFFNPLEFIAEALSNKKFAARLAAIPYKGDVTYKNTSILEQLYNTIERFLKKLFSTFEKGSVLEYVLGTTIDFIEQRDTKTHKEYATAESELMIDDAVPVVSPYIVNAVKGYLQEYIKSTTSLPTKENFKQYLKTKILVKESGSNIYYKENSYQDSDILSNFDQYFPEYNHLTPEERLIFVKGIENGDITINCKVG